MSAISKKVLALSAAALLGLSACSSDDEGGDGGSLVIATTNFSETKLIASMYEQVLEANGIGAEIKELTTREVIEPALSDGEVQVTPEYLATLTEFLNAKLNGSDAPPVASADPDETYAAAQPLAEQENITLLPPSDAQNQNAFAVTSEFADANSLTTLTELGQFSQQDPISLGGPPECPERPFCQPGLEDVYGVQVAEFKPYDAGGPLTIQALKQGAVDVGLVFSSSGSVAANDLVVLEDDQGWQLSENILPAVHTPSLTPEIEAALNSVSEVLTTEELQEMNLLIDVDRRSPEDVATEFLVAKGLITE